MHSVRPDLTSRGDRMPTCVEHINTPYAIRSFTGLSCELPAVNGPILRINDLTNVSKPALGEDTS